MKNKQSRKLFLAGLGLIVLLLFSSSYSLAQSRQSPRIMKNTKCEENASTFDSTVRGAKENSSIIAIAKLGNSENSTIYNSRRLKVLKQYLSYTTYSKALITAQGERVKGNGKVEVYINGVLELVFELSNKRDLQVGNCGY